MGYSGGDSGYSGGDSGCFGGDSGCGGGGGKGKGEIVVGAVDSVGDFCGGSRRI